MTVLTFDLLKRSRVTLMWWVIGMLAMAAYVVGVYDSLGAVEDLQDLYDQYPESLRELLGETDISTIDGWIHIELFSWLPLVLGIYGGIFAASNVSKEAEQRTLDFTLGMPVSRTSFIASRLTAGLVNMAVIAGLIWLVVVVGVALVGHTPSAGKYALALLNAYFLGVALFCGYVLIATFTDEQGRMTGIAIGVTLVLFIATGALASADAPEALRWLSPFEHYRSSDIIANDDVPVVQMLVLLLGATLAALAAVYWYNRRDLSS